jgi:hypothetical protein
MRHIMTTTLERVFYQPGQHWVWAYAEQNESGEWVDQAGANLEKLSGRYPGMTLITSEEAVALIEGLSKEAPVLIDAQTYDDALNVLPPMGWVHNGDSSSFRMSERTNGRITRIYVRLGKNYFRFSADFATSHQDAVAIVRAAAPALLAARSITA